MQTEQAKKPELAKNTMPQGTSFNMATYFKGVKQEWGRITWPTREQLLAETGVVVVVVTIFSLFVFVVDKLLQWAVQAIT